MIQPPIIYIPHFLHTNDAHDIFADLATHLSRQEYPITLFGKTYTQPRLIAFYGNIGATYTYSKKTLIATGWHDTLYTIKNNIEKIHPAIYNIVLCNLYRDGNDSMGRHADNEKELGLKPIIASVTLGAARVMHFRHKTHHTSYSMILEHGSLLIMEQGCQEEREHSIPKTKKIVGPRINLTFRYSNT